SPKGVAVSHQAAINLALSQIEAFAVQPESMVLQLASMGFDAAFSEWSTALLSGARLVLCAGDRQLAGENLQATAARGKVTVVTVPPSLLATLPEQSLPGVETLVVAGEACPAEVVAKWSQGHRLLN